jgi:hypothetical protein
MNKLKHENHRSAHPNGGKPQHDHRYYWKGIHRGWRIWLYAILMAAALLLFMMRRNWMGRISAQPQESSAGPVGN